jgi:hypothetical protein
VCVFWKKFAKRAKRALFVAAKEMQNLAKKVPLTTVFFVFHHVWRTFELTSEKKGR